MYKIFDTGCWKRSVHHISWIWAILVVAVVIFLSWFTKYRLLSLPPKLSVNDWQQNNQSFIGERAWNDLKTITGFGTRPTGSHANEVLSIDFFKRELSSIKRAAHRNQKMESDIQVASGAFYLNIYRNIQNVVVRLDGSNEAKNAQHKNRTLMLNCHFDSVAGSPGASDDAASCCVMLEILRVLSQQEKRLRHSVIFLFNGAEEANLLASHGFITQHPWAKDISAFINLESVGSNGKEILFQSGPNHGWLIDMYKHVPYPNGQVLAEEIFQSGIIPSDTDFRIFRDYGHIPGMDFAHFFNGYRYHTKYDHIDYLSPEVLQRTGDNILTLTRTLANSDELADTEAHANVRMIYYDILGFIFISYSELAGKIVNIVIPIIFVILSYYFLHTKDVSCRHVLKEIGIGFCAIILSLLLGGVICYLIAIELDFNGNTMSWYHSTYYSVALYAFPTIAVASVFYALPMPMKIRKSPLSLALRTQARLYGVNLFWALGSIILTISGYRAAYVFMVPVLIVMIVNAIIGLTRSQNTIRIWLYIHLAGQVLIVLWTTHLYHAIIAVFIPIAGRSDAQKNPDISIGIISCFFTMFIGSNLIPLVGLLRNPKYFLIIVASLFVVARLSLIGSYFGFPYSDDPANPTPQRHFITHAVRKVYDLDGVLRYNDSGFLFEDVDRNTKTTIDRLVAPDTTIRQELLPMCNELPYCGIPSNDLYAGGFWLPASAPIVENEVNVNSTKLKISDNKWQLQLIFNGSYLYSLQIRPRSGVNLLKWNLFNEINEFKGATSYFPRITHGLEAPPLQSDMEIETKSDHTGPLVDINILTFHWETSFKPTTDFANLLKRLPKWAYPIPKIASLQAHVF